MHSEGAVNMPPVRDVGKASLGTLVLVAVIVLAATAISRCFTEDRQERAHILTLDVPEDAPIAVQEFAQRLRNGSYSLAIRGYRVSKTTMFAQMAGFWDTSPPTSSALAESPQRSRWLPRIHRSPGRLIGSSGGSRPGLA